MRLPLIARLAGVAVLAACAPTGPGPGELPTHPCASESSGIEVAPPDGDFGDLAEGGSLWCGNPPQGGAPYTPFRIRLDGPEALENGVYIEMIATDLSDGSELAYTDLTMGLTCANVGESAGSWVGSEAHMRYYGQELLDLQGREAEITVRASALGPDPVEVEATWNVSLVLE